MDEIEHFFREVDENIRNQGKDDDLRGLSNVWMRESAAYKYSYNFTWMGRPIIQYPQDMLAMQEIIWAVQPDLIVETGIAHGGSLVFYASMLELLETSRRRIGQIRVKEDLKSMVIGVDIDIREHNRKKIEEHPMQDRIRMIQGSSTDGKVAGRIHEYARSYERPLICLDSLHTHEHVLKELELYSPLIKPGSYCVVFDTVIEEMPESLSSGRPWGRGNNPKTAIGEFLKKNDRFIIDTTIENKLLITVARGGYLKCVKG